MLRTYSLTLWLSYSEAASQSLWHRQQLSLVKVDSQKLIQSKSIDAMNVAPLWNSPMNIEQCQFSIFSHDIQPIDLVALMTLWLVDQMSIDFVCMQA